MGRANETFNKKEQKSKQAKKRKEKELKRQERKEQGKKGSLDDMLAWVDENGVIVSTPPDLSGKKEIKAENIEIQVPKAEFRVNNKIRKGRVNNFDSNKGFGFITDDDNNDSVFVHNSDCNGVLKQGSKVEFEVEKGIRGLKAINVKLL